MEHLESLGEDEGLHAVLVCFAPEVLDAGEAAANFATGDEVV